MRFADYSRLAAPAGFAGYARALLRRDSVIATLDVQREDVASLERTEMNAVQDSTPMRGRFPVVLLMAGENAETTAEAVLAEFLASHGYVVATVPWVGLDENHFDARRNQPGIEAVTRDIEFAWARLRVQPTVDPGRVATIGHSLGGIVAMLEAMRNADVRAAVGLDATYGFEGAVTVLTRFYDYAPRRMTASVLDLRKAAGEQNTMLDLAPLHSWYYTDRTYITLRHIRHSEFTTDSTISDILHEPPIPVQFQTPGWTRQTAAAGFVQACRMTKEFIDENLRPGGNPRNAYRLLSDAVARIPEATISRDSAVPPPPSGSDLVHLAAATSMDSVATLIERYHRDAPTDTILNSSEINNLGYQYLGEHRVPAALAAFRLVVRFFEGSANAYDSYGDGLLAAADTAHAIGAYQRALELAPSDSTLDPSSRDDLIKTETIRIKALTARTPLH